MATATITSKNQITVPREVRERLGVGPGDRLTFELDDDGHVAVEAETVELSTLRGTVRTAVKGVSVEAMKEAVRQRAGR